MVDPMPRLKNGRFAPRDCPECQCGTLQYQEPGFWECDGLVDPENNQAELEPCHYGILDGEFI